MKKLSSSTMRLLTKFTFSAILIMIISLFFISCSKEGPAGANGTNGTNGTNGVPGNMAITIKDVTVSTWSPGATAGRIHQGNVAVSEITNNIINGGAVLAYVKYSTGLQALPYTYSDASSSMLFYVELNKFFAERNYAVATTVTTPTNFRLVIIPGALGARGSGVAGSGHSLEELQAMSYANACAALGVNP